MATTKVRTTIRPLEELEVGPEEYLDLQRLGFLFDTKATTDDGLQTAAEKQTEQRSDTTPAEIEGKV